MVFIKCYTIRIKRGAGRGIAPIIAIGIAALALLGGAFLLVMYQPESSSFIPEQKEHQSSSDEASDVESASIETDVSTSLSPSVDAAKLMDELRRASGEVDPVRHAEMLRELDSLAARGLDATTLASLHTTLSKLTVGGSESSSLPPSQQQQGQQQNPPQQENSAYVETRPFWHCDPSKTNDWCEWARGRVRSAL